MVGVIETPAKLMEQWEAALKLAAETGYWADVYACGRVIEAFHDQIAKLLKPGTFSLSLVMSNILRRYGKMSANLNGTIVSRRRLRLACALPSLTATRGGRSLVWHPQLRLKRYARRMSTGSSSVTPNRVSKRAPEFILLAEEMTEKLNAAFEQFESRPSWWTE
jgi:hypothetical protein